MPLWYNGNMKKLIGIMIVITAVMVAVLARGSSLPFDTLGDALEVETPYSLSGFGKDTFNYVMEYQGKPVKVVCRFEKEDRDKIQAGGNAVMQTVLESLRVMRVVDLSGHLLDEDRLARLTGESLQYLMDNGFSRCGSHEGAWLMENDIFIYLVQFEGDDREPEKTTVKTIQLYGPTASATAD